MSTNSFLKEELILCYKNKLLLNNWKCECGYETIEEINKRSNCLRNENLNTVTTFFPLKSVWPSFIKKKIIQYELQPNIKFTNKIKSSDEK